jgi:N-acetylmuramic acid 6-phosphate etherase
MALARNPVMKSVTEQPNPRTREIDRLPTRDIVARINAEDQHVAEAVSRVLDMVAAAVDIIVERLSRGGRLFYVGTGTSGRLGVLDASECPPTFGVSPQMVQGIIAGGDPALRNAIEAAEDDPAQAARDLEARSLSAVDVVVGLSASGNTPYTVGALEFAKRLGAPAIAVSCNSESPMATMADISIAPIVGPEVIAGSSRMKAGTAEKMVLNMLSTATMIKLGFVYGNLMSNLKATNEKLRRRALAILREEAGLDQNQAQQLFSEAGGDLKVALLSARGGVTVDEARGLLAGHGGSVKRALDAALDVTNETQESEREDESKS